MAEITYFEDKEIISVDFINEAHSFEKALEEMCRFKKSIGQNARKYLHYKRIYNGGGMSYLFIKKGDFRMKTINLIQENKILKMSCKLQEDIIKELKTEIISKDAVIQSYQATNRILDNILPKAKGYLHSSYSRLKIFNNK